MSGVFRGDDVRTPPPRRQERTWLSFLIILLVMIVAFTLIWRGLSPADETSVGDDRQVRTTPTALIFVATPVSSPTPRPPPTPPPSPTLRPATNIVATPRPASVATPTPPRAVAAATPTARPPVAQAPTARPAPATAPVSDAEAMAVVREMFDGLHTNNYDRALAATSGQGREQMQTVVANIQDEGRRRGVQPELEITQLNLNIVERRDASILVGAGYSAGVYARVAVFRPLVETIVGTAIFRVARVNGQPKIVEVVSADGLPGL
jgi:hypothetical protein